MTKELFMAATPKVIVVRMRTCAIWSNCRDVLFDNCSPLLLSSPLSAGKNADHVPLRVVHLCVRKWFGSREIEAFYPQARHSHKTCESWQAYISSLFIYLQVLLLKVFLIVFLRTVYLCLNIQKFYFRGKVRKNEIHVFAQCGKIEFQELFRIDSKVSKADIKTTTTR